MKTQSFAPFFLIASLFLISCDETVSTAKDQLVKHDQAYESGIEKSSSTEEEDTPQQQTIDERIREIKALYAKIQASPNQNKDCTNKSKTTINYDIIEEGFPMTNKAKSCNLEDGLNYKQVELNGYEWGETTSFYSRNGKRFFAFTQGGAEGCGYEYRVYYNESGEIIRMLCARNECDGQEVSASVEVTKKAEKEEILNTLANAEEELKTLLGNQ